MPLVSPLKEEAVPSVPAVNRFEDFFQDSLYLDFKNHLYNYLLRKREINRSLSETWDGPVLEVGSGVSPVVESHPRVIYSDAAEEAMFHLKERGFSDKLLALSATQIPFRSGSIATVVCSEVLEHISEDRKAMEEMVRVLKSGGSLILTMPIHRYYFFIDDKFVKHERRYALKPLLQYLRSLGMGQFKLSKVTGLLEKVLMILVVLVFQVLSPLVMVNKNPGGFRHSLMRSLLPAYKFLNRILVVIIRWEAKLMPLAFSSIILVHCRKKAE